MLGSVSVSRGFPRYTADDERASFQSPVPTVPIRGTKRSRSRSHSPAPESAPAVSFAELCAPCGNQGCTANLVQGTPCARFLVATDSRRGDGVIVYLSESACALSLRDTLGEVGCPCCEPLLSHMEKWAADTGQPVAFGLTRETPDECDSLGLFQISLFDDEDDSDEEEESSEEETQDMDLD